tara:strand:+ start:1483 stop:1878 length:396 start_codon:yes stop_codon:yes gene_type:complete
MLDAPEAPDGFKHRWLRAEVRGHDDRANMSKRIREGFEPVRAEDHPDFDAPTIDEGRHAGVIGVGGLILAKIPEETVAERNHYYKAVTDDQLHGVDNDLMRDSDPRMPITESDIRRNSKTSFGSPRNSDSD